MNTQYVHGYSEAEASRLWRQAQHIDRFINWELDFAPGSRVLDAGCGPGAQTCLLAQRFPDTQFIGAEISEASLGEARRRATELELKNVDFLQCDLTKLELNDEEFDHVYMSFVLEHLPDRIRVLSNLRSVLKAGGKITITEGDHGTWCIFPRSKLADKVYSAFVTLQRKSGGEPDIGRELYPIVIEAGYSHAQVKPVLLYSDKSGPSEVRDFWENSTFHMINGVREDAISTGMISEPEWKEGMADLRKINSDPKGVAFYSFFQVTALK